MQQKHFSAYFVLCIVALWTCFLFAQAPQIEVTKLNGSLYKLTATTNFSVNMTASIGPDGILLIDTGMQGAAEAIRDELSKLSDKEIKYIINSHFHGDHFGGNTVLGLGAVKIAHSKMRENLTSNMNILQEYGEDVLPQITFEDSLIMHFNSEEIRLISLSGSHSNADIIVHFPESKVVVLSSVVLKETFPYIGRRDGGSVLNYPKILDYLLKSFEQDVIFISGHGENCTYADIKNFKNMIEETMSTVKQGLASGKTAEQLQEENVLKDWDSWGSGFVKPNMWIQTIANALNPPEAVPAKQAVAIPVFKMYKEEGLSSAIAYYKKLKEDKPEDYDYREFALNLFGYSLLNKQKFDDAIAIFKLNVESFPESANVYDSLGESFEKSDDLKSAKKNYAKAVKIAKKTNDATCKFLKQT